MWSCWPARDWTSQISYEGVATGLRALNVFEALVCFYTICTKYNAHLTTVVDEKSVDLGDLRRSEKASQPATGPLRSATRL